METQNTREDDADDLDQRDRLEDENEETTQVPPGFLSPSVREYLELGRSIPGTWHVIILIVIIIFVKSWH